VRSANDPSGCGSVDFDIRIARCTALIKSGSDNKANLVAAYLNRCGAYNTKAEFDLALADCDTAIKLEPNSSMGHLLRAAAFVSRKDYDRALGEYDRAMQLASQAVHRFYAYQGRGIVARERGDLDRAFAELESAIKLIPELDAVNRNGAASYVYAARGLV